jgi:hypothetical protein
MKESEKVIEVRDELDTFNMPGGYMEFINGQNYNRDIAIKNKEIEFLKNMIEEMNEADKIISAVNRPQLK